MRLSLLTAPVLNSTGPLSTTVLTWLQTEERSQILTDALEERMPQFALGRLGAVFDLGQ
jgi:hypothetical protein